MTDKQFDAAKKQLREEMKSQGFGWINGKYIEPPEGYKLREETLSCIGMINSILAYSGAGMTNAEEVMQMEERAHYNYLADYVKLFGRDSVVGLIQKQIDDIDYVKHCVYTDNEGVTYNSIVWKDEE